MKRALKIAGGVLLALVLLLAYEIVNISGFGVDSDHPGQVITHNIVDPTQLVEVSKFRSEAGHDFGGRGEWCLSMKHYFIATHDIVKKEAQANTYHTIAEPDGKNDITVYAPFDGYVTQYLKNPHAGYLMGFAPFKNHGIVLMLDHVFPINNKLHSGPIPFLTLGAGKVRAGEPIGKINGNEGFDVELRVGGVPWSDNWSSYFMGLTDAAYAEWKAVKNISPADYTITKAYRQAHPLQCIPNKDANHNNKDFVHPAASNDTNSYVILKPSIIASFAAAETKRMPTSDSGQVCDKNHLGVIRTTPQMKMKCRVIADGRITWGPLEG